MLTSLTAPGVIALLPSAQAFWGGLLHAPPNPWDSLQFLGCPWPALQGKARCPACMEGPRVVSVREGPVDSYHGGFEGKPLAHCPSRHTIAWPSGVLRTPYFQ